MENNRNKIVLDFEFNPISVQEAKAIAQHEIIEIGAVKVGSDNKIVDKFQRYIKPRYNTVVPKITTLTGITDEMLAESGSFEEVIEEFRSWIGEERFRIYSWSGTDRNVLESEIILKLGEDSEYYDYFCGRWIDLQKIYQRIMGFQKNMGLSNALGTLKVCFEGKEHGALADAINTAEVMKTLYDKERIDQIKHKSSVTYNGSTHSTGGFTMGNLFAEQFAKLGK